MTGGNPLFDRMTDGEIAAYLEDRDRNDSPEPPQDWLDEQDVRDQQRHRDQDHGGGACDCPPAEPQYTDTAPF